VSVIPTLSATMRERFIVNYRMPVEALAGYLPAPWLGPQDINGFALASFCLLDLRDVVAEPLPSRLGVSMISCAPRYAVIDRSAVPPRPAVFVTERYTNSAFGSFVTKLGFSAAHGHVDARIDHSGSGEVDLRVVDDRDELMFEAIVRPTSFAVSSLFGSIDEFVTTIAVGVRSYGLARHEGKVTVLDLAKDDACFEPFEALSVGGSVVQQWTADGAELDSIFRTTNARYAWTYHGLKEMNSPRPVGAGD
jgi:hypothetical protein